MNAPHTYRAAIFDLGGVLIDWNPRHLYRKLFAGDDVAMERFLAEVTTPAWNRQMDAGRPFQEGIDELTRDHPEQARLIQAYFDRWPEMVGGVDAAMVAILHDLRQHGLRLYALSDWSAETFAVARGRIRELANFDDILISGHALMTKPDPALFRMALERFGLTPDETFFVDDIAANVEGAQSVGMTAVQFTSADALRATLRRWQVL